MNWTLLDFVAFGGMAALTVSPVIAAMFLSRSYAYRAGVVIAAGAAFMVVWSALAVGIVADEQNDANFLYLGSVLIAIFGALIARFRAQGMAPAMFVTAFALVMSGVVALVFQLGGEAQDTLPGIVIGSGFFPALFAGSGWLLLQAAKVGVRTA